MLSPPVIMGIFIWWLQALTVSIVVYNLFTLVAVPTIYLCYLDKRLTLKTLLENQFLHMRKQCLLGALALLMVYWLLLGGYLLLYEVEQDAVDDIRVKIPGTFANYFFLCFFLGFTNPVLEEWFWRIFLQKVLGENFELNHLRVSLLFGFYHLFTFAYLATWPKGLFVMAAMMVSGRVFIFVQKKIGIVTAAMMHMGADWAILTIAFLIIFYVQKNKQIPLIGV